MLNSMTVLWLVCPSFSVGRLCGLCDYRTGMVGPVAGVGRLCGLCDCRTGMVGPVAGVSIFQCG